jgi:hypothetical protein
MERILLGDNQFFGINHMSEEQARASAIKFQTDVAIMNVLDEAHAIGINVFMCTTHSRIAGICEIVRSDAQRYRNFQFYPCMPYAHKFANAVSEFGMLEALNQFLPVEDRLTSILKNGIAIARKDLQYLIGSLIDAEMKPFYGLRTPVVFLQNVVTDLLLGLGFHQALRMFANHVREKYDAEPGYITMNLPKLLDALDAVGLENPIVCSNINKIGFRMSGGIDEYETIIAKRKFRSVAMSIFASGAIAPKEAVQYVCAQKNVESIVFGASTIRNIAHTKELIDLHSTYHADV